MQKQVKTGKNTEIHKVSDVKFWLEWMNEYISTCRGSNPVKKAITKSDKNNSQTRNDLLLGGNNCTSGIELLNMI